MSLCNILKSLGRTYEDNDICIIYLDEPRQVDIDVTYVRGENKPINITVRRIDSIVINTPAREVILTDVVGVEKSVSDRYRTLTVSGRAVNRVVVDKKSNTILLVV